MKPKKDGNENTTTETKKNIVKKEWGGIGNEKELIRACPRCGRHISHKTKESKNASEKYKRNCGSCGDICRRKTTDSFIEKAIIIHGKRYDYKNAIYTLSNKKVDIICQLHGIFRQSPSKHLSGQGCKKCASMKMANTANEFISSANKIHKNKYDYSDCIYKNSHEKVKIICRKHGEFLQLPVKHTAGQGCPKCSGNTKLGTDAFIEKSISIHGEKYNYSGIFYKNIYTKVFIICDEHGGFYQSPKKHINGQGCPKCHCHGKSKMESDFIKYMKIKKQNHRIKEWKNKCVDGFDKNKNIVYEFLGDYWHGNPEIYNRNDIHPVVNKTYGELFDETFNKFDKLLQYGYRVMYIWEKDWKDFLSNKSKFINIQTHHKNEKNK